MGVLKPAATICALLMVVMSANCSAQVGERNFFEPLITQDPNPSNELDIVPSWVGLRGGQDMAVAFSLEKQLSGDFSLELEDEWNAPLCRKARACEGAGGSRHGRARHKYRSRHSHSIALTNGFGDLEILAKYAFFASDRHEIRIAIGMNLALPTGEPRALASTHTYYGPILMFGKGMGDLPDTRISRYFRPFAIQADASYLIKAGGTQVDEFETDAVISYQPYYLAVQRHSEIEAAALRLTPFAEFTYDQVVVASHGGTQPDLRLLPGIAYVAQAYQLSLATELPINTATVHSDHASVIAMLSLTLDQIWPGFGWKAF